MKMLRHFNIVGAGLVVATVSYLHGAAVVDAERTLHVLASTDTLTGLLNRRRLESLVEIEQARRSRHPHPLSLIILDADHFKSVNDRYTHAGGDHVLRNIADRLRASLRTNDSLARWGGEEFLIRMPDTPLSAATKAAERLRTAVGDKPMRFEGQTFSVTITLGVCEVGAEETFHQALARADEALFQGKTGGRNRVEIARNETAA
jgi:diguanylate cyclase (GGDEF)-like protein